MTGDEGTWKCEFRFCHRLYSSVPLLLLLGITFAEKIPKCGNLIQLSQHSCVEEETGPPSPINHLFCVKNVVSVVISKYHLQRDSNIFSYILLLSLMLLLLLLFLLEERFIQIAFRMYFGTDLSNLWLSRVTMLFSGNKRIPCMYELYLPPNYIFQTPKFYFNQTHKHLVFC